MNSIFHLTALIIVSSISIVANADTKSDIFSQLSQANSNNNNTENNENNVNGHHNNLNHCMPWDACK